MAGVAFITAKKYVNGSSTDVFYIGSVQNDGYVYFNDETFYRCSSDGTNLQLFYIPKQIWLISSILQDMNILAFDVSGLLDTVAGLVGGSGSVAPNADVETAVQWMIKKATDEYITYSMTNRNLKIPNGSSYDCSSFVITGFYVGGFDINATTTRDIRTGFTAAGFEWIPGSIWYSNSLRRGDILLKEDGPNAHTQVYIGNNQDVNCGGTPASVTNHSPDNWGRGGWDGILRYAG